MATKPSPVNFIKVLQALQHVCDKAIPSVDKVINNWHSYQKLSITPCSQPHVCSTVKGKPKPNTSCPGCVKWGRAIEGVYCPQPPFITWKNIDSSLLHGRTVEVCSGFALHLPAGHRPTKISDYDTASILKIMMGFGEYHQNNQATPHYPDPYQTIHKVSQIRNDLSHFPIQNNMDIDGQTLHGYFQDIKHFVLCLEELQHLSQQEGNDIRAQLDKILNSCVFLTLEMEHVINDVVQSFQDQQKKVETSVTDELRKGFQDQQKEIETIVTDELQKGFQNQQTKLESTLADELEKLLRASSNAEQRATQRHEELQKASFDAEQRAKRRHEELQAGRII
ncbi:uncharacterized protein [Amphiura filiformis]|uniref:uncharacterized protein n=1 Tax=Amphiura filiformis TaxID=82378 RepID=UPI003B22272B